MPVPEIAVPRPSRSGVVPTKRALVDVDLRFAAVLAKNNADDIEAARRRLIAGQSSDILPSDGTNMLLLVQVNGSRWRSEIRASSRLDLDEAKDSAVPADKVDLTSVVGDAEVCRHNLVAETSQVEVGLKFTAFACQQVLWFSRWQTFGRDFQAANDELGQPDHEEVAVPAVTLSL